MSVDGGNTSVRARPRAGEKSRFATLLLATALLAAGAAYAQQGGGQAPTPQAPAPAAASADAGSDVAKANNPLADANALNFQNLYMPSLQGVPDASANTMFLRTAIVAGRHVIRGTLPISTVPTGQGQYRSGLGDLNLFDAIIVSPKGSTTQVAVGPLLVMPTATNSALGAGKWQAGAANVVIKPVGAGGLVGWLATWQKDFAGDDDRIGTNLATFQPLGIFQIGGGYYVRSSAIWLMDFKSDRYFFPAGLGIGKVFRIGDTVANAFIEPQFGVYSKGVGQPSFQLFVGLNLQRFR